MRTATTDGVHPKVSIVLPCLNEEETVGCVIRECADAFASSIYPYEIIVADNGSSDASREIAQSLGARVIRIESRGYGAALIGGFSQATGDVIVFLDSDNTYDPRQAPELVKRLMETGAALSIGSRMQGEIDGGAMPFLHQYLGTPVLTRLINMLFRGSVTDCNSGFRAFRKNCLPRWELQSTGMELASEMIVNCLKSGDRIVEMPIRLRRDARERTPHLSRWRDGMRHLLFILSRAPHGFTYTGIALLVLSMLAAIPAILIGPVMIRSVGIFDYHTLILAIMAGLIGSQSVVYGLMLDSRSKVPLPFNAYLLAIGEVNLLKTLCALAVMVACFVIFLASAWFRRGFNNIHYLRASLALLYLMATVGNLGFGLFLSHIYKRT